MIEILAGPYWIGSALLSPSDSFTNLVLDKKGIRSLRMCIMQQLYAQMLGWA